MRELGIKSVVDYAEIVKGKEDRIFLTDLRRYGQVLDFNSKMDLSIIDNFESVLKGVLRDMAVIHSNNYILTDDSGTKGFRAWFLLKGKTRDGFTGERVNCDVGGVERFPSIYINPNYGDKQFIHRVKKRYKQINLLSLMGIVSFDESFSREIFDKYVSSCKKPKHIMYAREIFTDFQKDKTKVIEEFNELAADY